MALEGSLENELLSHTEIFVDKVSINKEQVWGFEWESDGYGGAAIGLGKSRLEDFLESQRMETARKIWKCAHQNL